MAEGNGNSTNAERLDTIIGLMRQLIARERPQPRRLLRIEEAAAYLGISTGTLRRLIHEGEIPTVRIHQDSGHAPFLVDLKELDYYIEKAKS